MDLLKLVNRQNILPEAFVPSQLVQDPQSKVWVCERVWQAFLNLNAQMIGEKLDSLVLVSGYRAYAYQQKLYERKTNWLMTQGLSAAAARQRAAEIVAPPGCSEHQLGLAIDVTAHTMRDLKDPLTEDFQDTPEGLWLKKNAYHHGFVLRYPKDKMSVTQITYEPWHYRYVGLQYAKDMYEYDLCLEEYIQYLAHSS